MCNELLELAEEMESIMAKIHDPYNYPNGSVCRAVPVALLQDAYTALSKFKAWKEKK